MPAFYCPFSCRCECFVATLSFTQFFNTVGYQNMPNAQCHSTTASLLVCYHQECRIWPFWIAFGKKNNRISEPQRGKSVPRHVAAILAVCVLVQSCSFEHGHSSLKVWFVRISETYLMHNTLQKGHAHTCALRNGRLWLPVAGHSWSMHAMTNTLACQWMPCCQVWPTCL